MVTNFIDDVVGLDGIGARVVYREYASLSFFVVIEKQSESELAILDFIQFLVEVLDKQFGNNVCEVDLVFNPEKLHYIIDEVVMDGIVVSTDVAQTTKLLQDRSDNT